MTHWKIISPRKDYIYYCSLQSLVVMTFRRRMCTLVQDSLLCSLNLLLIDIFSKAFYSDGSSVSIRTIWGVWLKNGRVRGGGLDVLVLVLAWPSGWRFSNGDHGHHQHLVLDWVRDHQDGVLVMVMVLAWPSTVKMGGRASWYACLGLDRHVRAPTN